MNYRHGFHAGNFADLAKHAATLSFMRHLRQGTKPLSVVDTHAGAGYYDLTDAHFARSKEAEAGIKYLLNSDVPDSLKPLAGYVRAKNAQAGFHDQIGIYPGSPLLVLDHLRQGDGYVGCELRDDDFGYLHEVIEPRGKAKRTDGYTYALSVVDVDGGVPIDVFWLVDPPFEKPDDYDRIVDTLSAGLRLRPGLTALIWLPLKDLETLDKFLRDMEQALFEDAEDEGVAFSPPNVLVAELRLRSLWTPMKMNGCVLVAINAPPGFEADITGVSQDVVAVFGEDKALAKVWRL